MRPIDADALKDRLQALAYDDWNQGVSTSWADAYREVAEMVEEQPTIDAVQEPEKGRWCFTPDGMMVCSNCHDNPTNRIIVDGSLIYDMTPIKKRMKFCPNCGASMTEGAEDELV